MAGFGKSMQGVSSQLITLFGGGRTVTLRRYDEVPNPVTGKTERTLAETLTPRMVQDVFKQGERDGLRHGDMKLIVEGKDLSATAPLDGSWTAQIEGESRAYPVIPPITNLDPDGDLVVWEVAIRKGAGSPAAGGRWIPTSG